MNLRTRAIVAALAMLPSLLQAQQQVTVTAVPPPAVTAVGASVSGTPGNATACYWVVVNYTGGAVMAPRGQCVFNVPNTLSGSNFIQISWTALNDAVSYDVLKTTTSAGPVPGASVALATGLTVTTTNDQGGGLSAYTATAFPYSNARGTLTLDNRNFLPPIYRFSDFAVGVRGIQGTLSGGLPIIPRGTSNVQIGNATTPFQVDSTGAALTANYVVSATATIAQVNAGLTLVAAVTGRTLTVNHVILQAIGGAVATCTDVRISDTVPTLDAVTAAVAALTQNTVVSEYTPTTVTLSAFAPTTLTANTGIQIRKTGASCATATSIKVIVYYTINS